MAVHYTVVEAPVRYGGIYLTTFQWSRRYPFTCSQKKKNWGNYKHGNSAQNITDQINIEAVANDFIKANSTRRLWMIYLILHARFDRHCMRVYLTTEKMVPPPLYILESSTQQNIIILLLNGEVRPRSRPLRISTLIQSFTLVTDHIPLTSLKNLNDFGGWLTRWSLFLQQLDSKVVYIRGSAHTNADCLSRIPTSHLNSLQAVDDYMLHAAQLMIHSCSPLYQSL